MPRFDMQEVSRSNLLIKRLCALVLFVFRALPVRCDALDLSGWTIADEANYQYTFPSGFTLQADVRDERDESFVIISRSDARGTGDGSLNDALDRVNAYLDAGADIGFVEGPTDPEELQRVGREIDGPLLYNFVGDLGTSPYVDMDDLDEWGFDVVLFPILSTLSTIANVYADMQAFAGDPAAAMRSVDDAFDAQSLGSLHEFSGFPEVVEWEKQYLPEADQEKYEGSLGDDLTDS